MYTESLKTVYKVPYRRHIHKRSQIHIEADSKTVRKNKRKKYT